MNTLLQDIRYAVRTLRKNPGFALVGILTLGLGIGVNTAIFSTVNGVLLRPLPYPDSGRLVRVWSTSDRFPHDVSSYPDFRDFADQNKSLEQMSAYSDRSFNLSGGDHPERIRGLQASAGLLELLRVRPMIGRSFSSDEQQPGRNHVVLLGGALWRSHFAARHDVLGKTVKLNDANYTVIGVLPAFFGVPPGESIGLMVPLPPDVRRSHGFLSVVGRLKPGTTIDQAQAELSTIAGRLARQYREDKGQGANIQPLQSSFVNEYRPALLVLLGAVGFVLLIACANVANLFLGRATSRQRELAVRASLGASRGRLIRQQLTESVLVGMAGGAFGLLLASWGVTGLAALLAHNFAAIDAQEIAVDRWVLAFALGLSLLTGLVSGLAPALGASKIDLNESLKEGSRAVGSTTGHNRFRSALVVSEVALALVLLSGAGLMVKSFVLLTQVDSGLHPQNVLTVDFSLVSAKYSHTATRAALFHQILERVKLLPGVQSAAAAADVPLTDNEDGFGFSIEGLPDPPGREREARFNVVGPAYFATLGIPLVAGRDLADTDAEGAPIAVVINQAMVRRFWPNQNPLGQRITTDKKTWYSIVGVAGDVRQLGLRSEAKPEVYVSYLQDPYQWPHLTMLVRTGSDPLKLFGGVEQAVWSVDKDQPVSNPMTMDQIRSDSIAQPRVTALVLGLFAALALLLASVGLYGVVVRSVTERTHEIGVRMALGASPVEILRLVVGHGMILALVGAGIGLIGSWLSTRALVSFLFGVRPTDPLTFGVVSLLLTGVTLLASYIPARRATRVDPMVALRYE
jgi:predicted permease